MAWKLKIGEGAQQVILHEPTTEIPGGMNFQLGRFPALAENGTTQYVDTIINVAGDIEPEVGRPVENGVIRLLDLAAQGTPVRVILEKDATTILNLAPGDHQGTPKVTEFETLPDDGAGESHWPYRVKILARRPGQGAGGTALSTTEMLREIAVLRYNRIPIRKTWSITVTAKTLNDAVREVLRRRPSAKPITEEIRRAADQARCSAVWTWEAARGQIVEVVEEPARIIRGDPQFVFEELTGERPPIAHKGRDAASIVVIRGVTRAVAAAGGLPPRIAPPDPHLEESDEIKRLPAEGGDHIGNPALFDSERGIYERHWEERYAVLKPGFSPEPNHRGHDRPLAPNPSSEPPDGNFFS